MPSSVTGETEPWTWVLAGKPRRKLFPAFLLQSVFEFVLTVYDHRRFSVKYMFMYIHLAKCYMFIFGSNRSCVCMCMCLCVCDKSLCFFVMIHCGWGAFPHRLENHFSCSQCHVESFLRTYPALYQRNIIMKLRTGFWGYCPSQFSCNQRSEML